MKPAGTSRPQNSRRPTTVTMTARQRLPSHQTESPDSPGRSIRFIDNCLVQLIFACGVRLYLGHEVSIRPVVADVVQISSVLLQNCRSHAAAPGFRAGRDHAAFGGAGTLI